MTYQKLKVEFHSHTDFDPYDSVRYSAYELIDEAAKHKFDVLAITCHDALQWSSQLREYAESAGILLIPGVEATIEGKHVLIYGLTQFQKLASFSELRELRKSDPEIFTIAPHPFFPGGSCLHSKLLQHLDCFDAIEYSHFYTSALNFNAQAVTIAKQHQRPLAGTGDVHLMRQLGRTYTVVNAMEKSYRGVRVALQNGEVELISQPFSPAEFAALALGMKQVAVEGLLMRWGLMTRRGSPLTSATETVE